MTIIQKGRKMGRLIDKDDAIRIVEFECGEWRGLAGTISRAIQRLPSAQQWIPCSEMMPEEETDVLICNSTGNIAISRGAYTTEASDWIWYTSGWRFGEVIAWMPLPEPWRGEE